MLGTRRSGRRRTASWPEPLLHAPTIRKQQTVRWQRGSRTTSLPLRRQVLALLRFWAPPRSCGRRCGQTPGTRISSPRSTRAGQLRKLVGGDRFAQQGCSVSAQKLMNLHQAETVALLPPTRQPASPLPEKPPLESRPFQLTQTSPQTEEARGVSVSPPVLRKRCKSSPPPLPAPRKC